jgi:hypothetical protein
MAVSRGHVDHDPNAGTGAAIVASLASGSGLTNANAPTFPVPLEGQIVMNSKQGPVIIIEPCGCRVDHGIPTRCKQHELPRKADANPHTEAVNSETAYGRTVGYSFTLKVF